MGYFDGFLRGELMDKVLVTKAIRPNYNTLGGGPVMVVGGNQGRGSRGRTGLERLGRGIGGLVGVTGALTGQHRSLGSLANAMVSGGAQVLLYFRRTR